MYYSKPRRPSSRLGEGDFISCSDSVLMHCRSITSYHRGGGVRFITNMFHSNKSLGLKWCIRCIGRPTMLITDDIIRSTRREHIERKLDEWRRAMEE